MVCPPPAPFISWAVWCNQYIPLTIQCQFSRFPFGKWYITFLCHIWSKAVQMSNSQCVKVPLNDSTAIWCISSSSQSCISCRIPEGAFCPTLWVVFEKVLNSIDPSSNHRGVPLVTVLKMHFLLMMAAPLSLECSHFSVYPTASLSHPELTSLPVRKLQCQKPC